MTISSTVSVYANHNVSQRRTTLELDEESLTSSKKPTEGEVVDKTTCRVSCKEHNHILLCSVFAYSSQDVQAVI